MVKRTSPERLPQATERALIQVLVDKQLSAIKFKTVCDKSPDLFGEPGTKFRTKVQKRRDYLRRNSAAFRYAVRWNLDSIASPSSEERSELCSPPVVPRLSPDSPLLSPDSRRLSPAAPKLSSTPPRSMSRRSDDDDDDDRVGTSETYNLDIERPWQNPFGMIVVKGTEVEEEKTVVDKLTILKPIFDSKDFDGKFYNCRLCNDGGGIIVTEPTIPRYLWQAPGSIVLLVDEKTRLSDVCQPTFRTYKTIKTEMKKKPASHYKEIIYRFPRGTTCNNEFFNAKSRRSSQYDLDTNLQIQKDEIGEDELGVTQYQFLPFVVWRVAIDGPGKQTADEDEDVSATAKAFAKFGIKKRGDPPERGNIAPNLRQNNQSFPMRRTTKTTPVSTGQQQPVPQPPLLFVRRREVVPPVDAPPGATTSPPNPAAVTTASPPNVASLATAPTAATTGPPNVASLATSATTGPSNVASLLANTAPPTAESWPWSGRRDVVPPVLVEARPPVATTEPSIPATANTTVDAPLTAPLTQPTGDSNAYDSDEFNFDISSEQSGVTARTTVDAPPILTQPKEDDNVEADEFGDFESVNSSVNSVVIDPPPPSSPVHRTRAAVRKMKAQSKIVPKYSGKRGVAERGEEQNENVVNNTPEKKQTVADKGVHSVMDSQGRLLFTPFTPKGRSAKPIFKRATMPAAMTTNDDAPPNKTPDPE